MSSSSETYYTSLLYAFISIFLWSLSASIADLLRNDANYLGFQLVSMAAGAVFFGVWTWYDRDNWRAELRDSLHENREGSLVQLVAALVGFGLFLLLYGLSFLFSIQEGPSVPANIINYLWPIFFPALGALVFRRKGATFGWREASALSLAFAGASLIAGGSIDIFVGGLRFTYLVAFVAALSAGIYLNFLSIAQQYVNSTQFIYFVGTVLALPTALLAAVVFDLQIQLTPQSLPFVIAYGFVTFGGGQLAWGKAVSLGEDALISSLAYLTPILSTLFLSVLADEPITGTVAFAGVLIIVAQVLLNDTFRHFSSISGGAVSMFLVALIIYVDPPIFAAVEFFTTLDDVIATIFAILTGFMLNRVWQVNQAENKRLMDINFRLKTLVSALRSREDDLSADEFETASDAVHRLIVSLIDLNYAKRSNRIGPLIRDVERDLETCEDTFREIFDGVETVDEDIDELRQSVFDWLMLSQERVSRGEILVLVLLGAITILLFLANAGDTFLSSLVTIVISGAIVFSVLKVRDYNYNRTGASSKVLLEQDIMDDLKRPMYFPDENFAYDPELTNSIADSQRVYLGESPFDPDSEVTSEAARTIGELKVQEYVRYGVFAFVGVALFTVVALIYVRMAGEGIVL